MGPALPARFRQYYRACAPACDLCWIDRRRVLIGSLPAALCAEIGTSRYINFAAVGLSNAAVYYYCGGNGLFYLCCGTLIGMGIHPVAGHFIAEHYTFIQVG